MLKKILIASILFLLIVSFSNTARAAIELTNPLGYYQINGGKMSASVNFKNIVLINVSLPNMAILKGYLGGCFYFDYWLGEEGQDYGEFGMYFPIDFSSLIPGITLPISNNAPMIVGDWQMTGTGKFKIVPVGQNANGSYYDLNTLSDLEDYINGLLAQQGGLLANIEVTVKNYSFTGSWSSSSDTIKANLSLSIGVSIYGIVNGTITLTGSNISTSRGTIDQPTPPATIFSAPNGNANATSKDLGNWVVDVIKALPLKDVVPAD